MSDLADFFDGVAEMRAYLDRHSDRSGRERLKRMAFDLTKPRSFDALASWLCTSLVDALSLRGASLALHGDTHTTVGTVKKSAGTAIDLNGTSGVFGSLWLEHVSPIDPTVTPLLHAVVDAVAMTLDAVRERSRLAEPV